MTQFPGVNLKEEQAFAARKEIFAGLPQPEVHNRHSATENKTTEIPAPDSRDHVYESKINMYVPALLMIGLVLILYFSKTGTSFKSRS
ncbi:hypothetical protein [Chryseobacterium populi]|nr:hypothetical protein [Chryseobacterium populi]